MPGIEPPSPTAQRLLGVIAREIASGRIRANQPETFLAFSEALALLGEHSPAVLSGSKLSTLGLHDLHVWTEEHDELPKVTGLIVYKKSRRPHDDFPKWHGHESDPDWAVWWMEEANKAINYDWWQFLGKPPGLEIPEMPAHLQRVLEKIRVQETAETMEPKAIERITFDPARMGGKPCIRGMRVTVGTIVGLVAAGRSHRKILELYPYLEPQDIQAALRFAAWRSEEQDLPLTHA